MENAAGKYEVERLATDHSKGYSMSAKFDEVPKEDTPGPSTYYPKDCTRPANRSVIIAEKIEPNNRPKTPGPGEVLIQ